MNHFMKSISSAAFLGAISLCGIAAILVFLDRDTRAYSACQLNLPPGTASMTVSADNASCDQLPTSFNGYVSSTFSDIPDGFSIFNDTSYTGLCADLEGYVLDFASSNATYEVQLSSSVENPAFAGRPWDKVNYILNHYPIPQNSWLDVQAAIWKLIYPDTSESPYGCSVNQNNVQTIVNDANTNGSGFTPGNGNLFAIIINPLSCAGNSSSYCNPPDGNHLPYQLLFTTATCSASYTVTPSAGAGGSISPLTPQTVNYNAPTSFTVTPDAGYLAVMSGTCGGNLAGNTYTTNPITADCTVNASFAVAAPLTITTASLPSGTVLNPYSQTLTATGGVLPYAWSISGGSLPDGLNISGSTGEISGSPTTAATFNFTAQVTDKTSSTAVRNLSIATAALPVRYGNPGSPINPATVIQNAYDQCVDGYVVQVQALEFSSNDISFDRPITITLQGGFDENFTSNPSFTTINGTLTIHDGTVVIENIVIK